MTIEQTKELQEYIKNKIIILNREIFALQAKKDAYHDIELELYGYVDRCVDRCVDNEELEQPDKCKFVKNADCCYPIEDCINCPNHKESD